MAELAAAGIAVEPDIRTKLYALRGLRDVSERLGHKFISPYSGPNMRVSLDLNGKQVEHMKKTL